MEEQEERSHDHDQEAKAHVVMLMQMGYPWQKAEASAGLHISRSTAYRLLQAVRTRGEAALQDGRHGHPAKLREAMLQWLLVTCRADPQMPSREVQAALQEQFGIHVSIGHLNRVRTQLGIGHHVGRLKKTRTAFFSGIAAPPEQVNSVQGFCENDGVHVELRADSRPAFVAFATAPNHEEPDQNR